MLNRSGITSASYGAPRQILANVEIQASVGCIVPQSLGTDLANGKKIRLLLDVLFLRRLEQNLLMVRRSLKLVLLLW